jgi:tetratricopeptide (TPR) repeat protein
MCRVKTPERRLLILIAILALASLLSVNDALLYTPDSARYLIWAQSLSRFDGFNDFTLPDPTRYVVHAPFYPFVLVPAAWIDPGGVVAAKVTNILLGAFLVWLFFRWLRRTVGPAVAAWTSSLLAVNALTLIYSAQVLSEVPFAIAFVGAAMLAEDLDQFSNGRTAAELAAIVLALGAAMFLREIGVTLVAAFVVLWWLAGHRRTVFIVGGLCLLVYALWFLRNEVIVAGIEQPPLRNSKLLTAHLYTAQDESLVAELTVRVITNARVYGNHLASLVFAPDLGQRSHALIPIGSWHVQATMAALTVLRPLYLVITLVLPAFAIIVGRRTTPSVKRVAVFLGLYAVPVLLYPINDIRFLYPVLIGFLFLGAVGWREGWSRLGGRLPALLLRPVAIVAVLLAYVPHTVWATAYFAINGRMAHDRERLLQDPGAPDYYRKTLAEAGRWLRENVEPGATILSRWKEVALEAGDRHVLDVDPQMTPDNFDRTIRDYDVRYIASVTWLSGLRENETQLEYSSKYRFVPLHRAGSVEILRVEPKDTARSAPQMVRSTDDSVVVFRTAVRMLRRSDPAVAESLLQAAEQRMGRFASIVYQRAVAKALAGRLDEAMEIFERVRSIPQAGSLLQQSYYHTEIISRWRVARGLPPGDERATRFHVVGVNYWELGYREQAYRMIDSSLASQPGFFPALIFASIFRYQDGQTAPARSFLQRASELQPANPLVTTMRLVLDEEERWASARTAEQRADARRRQAQAFMMVNMREDAVDAWRGVLQEVPNDVPALAAMTGLMEDKRRFGPARAYAQRWVEASANAPEARERLEALERRW